MLYGGIQGDDQQGDISVRNHKKILTSTTVYYIIMLGIDLGLYSIQDTLTQYATLLCTFFWNQVERISTLD